ncbi:hypothetical protein [Prosthecomicrobium sp. N25]|uniref:hypothetical protein n=1 Tax=Prosthecomicrobium sp. N25 TaxID=3129254 RepID=UPI00307707EB
MGYSSVLLTLSFMVFQLIPLTNTSSQENQPCPFGDQTVCIVRFNPARPPRPTSGDEYKLVKSESDLYAEDFYNLINNAVSRYAFINPLIPPQAVDQMAAVVDPVPYESAFYAYLTEDAYYKFYRISFVNGAKLVPHLSQAIRRAGGLRRVDYLLSKSRGNNNTLHGFAISTVNGAQFFGSMIADLNGSVIAVGVQNPISQ